MRSPTAGARAMLALGAAVLASMATAPWRPVLADTPTSTTPPTHAMTREAVVRDVLDANRQLAAATLAWHASSEQPAQVGALPDPTVSWSVAPATFGPSQPGVGQQVVLRQALPSPGSLAPRVRAAEARAEALSGDLEALRRTLGLEAARAVDELGRIEASLALLDQHAALLVELKASAEARYAAGQARAQDPIQADVALAHVEHQRVVSAAERRLVQVRLSVLLHRPPDALPGVGPLVDAPARSTPMQGARPELLAARADERGAQELVHATRRSALPELALMGSYSSMWMQPEHRWMLGLGVEVPLQQGARRAELRQAEALAEAARAEREYVEDAVAAELQSARASLQEARHVLRLFDERLLPAARTRVAVARAAFEVGAKSFDTLIDAERSLRDAELGRVGAVALTWTRESELVVASGGALLPTALPGGTP